MDWLHLTLICGFFPCSFFSQEDMNKQISADYSEQTRRAMAQMSEKEMNFDLIEVNIMIMNE